MPSEVVRVPVWYGASSGYRALDAPAPVLASQRTGEEAVHDVGREHCGSLSASLGALDFCCKSFGVATPNTAQAGAKDRTPRKARYMAKSRRDTAPSIGLVCKGTRLTSRHSESQRADPGPPPVAASTKRSHWPNRGAKLGSAGRANCLSPADREHLRRQSAAPLKENA